MSGLPWGGVGGLGLQEDPRAPAAAWQFQPLGPTNVHVGAHPTPRNLLLCLGLAYGLTLGLWVSIQSPPPILTASVPCPEALPGPGAPSSCFTHDRRALQTLRVAGSQELWECGASPGRGQSQWLWRQGCPGEAPWPNLDHFGISYP